MAAVRLFLRAGLGLPGGLVTASWNGHCDLLGELLAGGVDAGGLPGAEALLRAHGRGHEPCARQLVAAGASLDAAGENGETLLIRAARQGAPVARFRRLLDLGADPNLTTKAGATALMYAATGRRARRVHALLAAGADAAARDLDGWTALHFAARDGGAAAARELLAVGAEIDARSELGWTPLQLAVREGALPVVELLCVAGADVNAISRVAHTPLVLAVRSGRAKVAAVLLAAGADPALAVDGFDAAWWAERSHSRAIAALRPRLSRPPPPSRRDPEAGV